MGTSKLEVLFRSKVSPARRATRDFADRVGVRVKRFFVGEPLSVDDEFLSAHADGHIADESLLPDDDRLFVVKSGRRASAWERVKTTTKRVVNHSPLTRWLGGRTGSKLNSFARRGAWWIGLLGGIGTAVVKFMAIISAVGNMGSLLGARESTILRLISLPRFNEAIHADNTLAYGLFVGLVSWAVLRRGNRHTLSARRMSWATRMAAALSALGYLLSDLAENHRLLKFGSAPDLHGLGRDTDLKWGFLVTSVLLLISLMAKPFPLGLGGAPIRPPKYRGLDNAMPDVDWKPSGNRGGIAVSGGGIRSASFALGALQELQSSGMVRHARYITSVSGGSYITGAIALANRANPVDQVPYEANGPEEQKLRRNLHYLVGNRVVFLSAVSRVLVGLLINLLLAIGVIFAVVRPVGWLIGTTPFHPELRVNGTVVTHVDQITSTAVGNPTTTLCERTNRQTIGGCAKALGEVAPVITTRSVPTGDIYNVDFNTAGLSVCVDTEIRPSGPLQRVQIPIVQRLPGVIQVKEGKQSILRQPELELGRNMVLKNPGCASDAAKDSPLDPKVSDERACRCVTIDAMLRQLFVSPQPKLVVDDLANLLAGEAPDVSSLRLATQPGVRSQSVMLQRETVEIDHRDLYGLGGIGLGGLIFMFRVLKRPKNWRLLNRVASVAVIVGMSALLLQAVLPWLVDVYPRRVSERLVGGPAGVVKLPILGTVNGGIAAYVALAISTIRRYAARPKKTKDPKKPIRANAAALSRKLIRFAQHVFVGVILIGLALVSVLWSLVLGAANGPNGHLPWLSHDIARLNIPFPADLAMWFVVVVLLFLSRTAFEASAWSLGPIYKRRLYWAFGLVRNGDRAKRLRFPDPEREWEEFVCTPATDGGPRLRSERAGYLDGALNDGTELVLCCSANVLGEDRVPSGRRATSFTVSRSVIGGPEIGWMKTPDYLARMGPRRRWDLNIPAIVSVSGAAVSPAMGRQSLGPIGSVLAMLNVRLGTWLPNPHWVRATDPTQQWDTVPGWTWFAREVVRRHRIEAPYLYVTDGGHWENLGLVEALRRGCMFIVCISAAGDGEYSMATLGEAIEIARTDLNVTIDMDVASMRPRAGGEPDATLPSGRQYLLTDGVLPTIGRAAARGYTFGKIRYPGEALEGHLLYIDAVMVDALPIDVHAYAEKHPEFPNVSTGDQFFDASDFEAYRSLGTHLVRNALASTQGLIFARDFLVCDRL